MFGHALFDSRFNQRTTSVQMMKPLAGVREFDSDRDTIQELRSGRGLPLGR
jgi:hypothetical protein